MFGIGTSELLLIFGIVLLLFGGRRLPEIAQGLGAAIRNFKTALKEPVETQTSTPQSRIADTSPVLDTQAVPPSKTPTHAA